MSRFAIGDRFDQAVWGVVAVVLLLTALVIGRGDQVGVRVIALAPAPDTVGISPSTPLRIRFDQRLDPDTLAASALTLTPPVSGTLRAEGSTLVFAPSVALAPDTAYAAELTPGLRSVQGRGMVEPLRWNFTTGHTSVLYSVVDDNGREQLMLAAATLRPDQVALESPQQITQAPYGIWDFAADPRTGQVIVSLLNEDGTSDLYTLPPGSTTPTLLYACPGAACNSVAFSPNSLLLAFSQRNASGFGVPVVSPPRLWLLELGTSSAVPVFSDGQQLAFDPRWSYDGTWLSYLSPDLGGVGIYHLDNGLMRFYPTTTGEAAVWHPQRDELVMSETVQRDPYVEAHLFAVDPLTEERRDLSAAAFAGPVEDNAPAFSPDGAWIAFRRKELEGPRASLGKQLWRMRADGSDPQPLTSDLEADHGPPTWSPDGRYLLYHRFPLRGPDVTIAVWIMDVATQQTWEVARPGQRPQWIP